MRRLAALLLALGLVAVLAAGCETGTLGSEVPTVLESIDTGPDASPPDDGSDVAEPPTLAPVPSGAKAGAKCDAAFKTWVDWWVAYTTSEDTSDESDDPNAVPSNLPSGDPDQLEHTVFNSCTLTELAAANASHLIKSDTGDPPYPYIEYEIGWSVAAWCDEDSDIVADTKLCAPYASPSPNASPSP